MTDTVAWHGITVTRTPGQHGTGPEELADMGQVSGFVLQTPGEPTLYWTGDTILYGPVLQAIERFRPDVVVTHSSGAMWKGNGPIVMDAAQTLAVCQAAPASRVVAIHLDSLDHGEVSREALRAQARAAAIPEGRLLIPEDGECLGSAWCSVAARRGPAWGTGRGLATLRVDPCSGTYTGQVANLQRQRSVQLL